MESDTPMNAIAIQQSRLRLRLTQSAFASLLHISFPTVSRWENGHRLPVDGYTTVVLRLLDRINLDIIPAAQVVQTLRVASDKTEVVVRLVRMVDRSSREVAA